MFLYIHILNAVIVNNVSVLSAPCSAYRFSLNVLFAYSLKGSAVLFCFVFFFFFLFFFWLALISQVLVFPM